MKPFIFRFKTQSKEKWFNVDDYVHNNIVVKKYVLYKFELKHQTLY